MYRGIGCTLRHVQNRTPAVITSGSSRQKNYYRGKKQQNLEKIIYEDKNVPPPEAADFETNEFLARRLTYMPPDLPQHQPPKKKPWKVNPPKISVKTRQPVTLSEYTETAEYPPIVNMQEGHLRSDSEARSKRLSWYRQIEQLPTFDQKQFEIMNQMPLPTICLASCKNVYNYLPLYKYLTRTHVIDADSMPQYESSLNDDLINGLTVQAKPLILAAIKAQLDTKQVAPFYEKNVLPIEKEHRLELLTVENIIQNVNSILTKLIGDKNPHLDDTVVELNADIRSWWYSDKLPPSKKIPSFEWLNYDKFNVPIQYEDYAPLNLRMKSPLKPIVKQDDVLLKTEIPVFPTNPFKLGFGQKWLYVQQLPGYLPSLEQSSHFAQDSYDFPLVSFLNRGLVKVRDQRCATPFGDENDVVSAMAVMHNFAYLNALAAVNGFTPYHELTYPLVNQSVITDGQNWSFHFYQLNSHTFHNDVKSSDNCNVCWSTQEMKLYETYEDGQFSGINDDVIKHLIKIYLQKPQVEPKINLKPYLSEDNRSPDERNQLRTALRRRYGQVRSAKEWAYMCGRRTYAFEWIYMRHPEASSTIHWRMPNKPKFIWPTDKIVVGIQKSKINQRIELGG